MADSLENISNLYKRCPDVLFLHGITRIGGEVKVPQEKPFSERIAFAIDNSNKTKLSAHSFAFHINDRRHLWSGVGIILQEATIISANIEDTGLTTETLHLAWTVPKPDYQVILLSPNRLQHNEFVVRQVTSVGIYIYGTDSQLAPEEIRLASLGLNLPVYFLLPQGLFRTRWDTGTNSFALLSDKSTSIDEVLNGLDV
jgi:hypothetical protein